MTESTNSRREFLGSVALAGAAVVMAGSPAGANAAELAATGLHELFPGAINAEGAYVLPPLKYDYSALAPVIDSQTMNLHHARHHQSYVDGLIAAEAQLARARETGDFALVEHWSQKAAFHGAGHLLHCVFWDSIGPVDAGGQPSARLTEAITREFGSVEKLLAHFAAASIAVEGSGWAIIGYSIAARKLVVLQARNHQFQTQWGIVPLLCNDVWEHAYYLNYQNRRADYVRNFPRVIAWERVNQRFDLISQWMG